MANEKQIKAKAKEIIETRNLKEIFLTSDLQGFTEKQRAENNASYRKDKKVYHFQKSDFIQQDTEPTADEPQNDDTEERQQLVERYEQLFEKKPAHNIGIDKLKEKIAEKEQELEEAKKITVQDATEVTAAEGEDLNND